MWYWKLGFWMSAGTIGSQGAEACEIILACHTPDVLARTCRTKLAEATLVIRALYPPLLRMRVQTLVSGRAVAIFREPPALGHAPQVVLVQEFARIALFAEAAQPVLADRGEAFTLARVCRQRFWRLEVLCGRLGVAQRAMQGPEGTPSWREGQPAYLIVFVQLDAELVFDVRLFCEVVLVELGSDDVAQRRGARERVLDGGHSR